MHPFLDENAAAFVKAMASMYYGKAYGTHPLGWARQRVQHNGQGWDYSMWHYALGWQIQQFFEELHGHYTHFGPYYECMIIIGRLCHIMWSWKWHNLPP